ncbi:radical SAM/SPASM domain-containing protein [Clostridium sp. UBA6640]|uniref:radical SAM/SPASM domain-containing protein n=1 Tax=Clostridium sp. UBA6640 TaxID=1946370 RepID=UPI0025C1A378|nr:radical SAM protein [Clostridium sp. UBA6640]
MFEDINFLVLWLTNDCNLRCKYCYANGGEKKEYMTFEMAKKALSMPKSNFKLQLAGGEPLLNFQLIKDIYNYLKVNNKSVRLQMQTNGALIDREIAREIKKMNIAIGISMDGPIEINEKLRGKSAEVINGIRMLGQEGVMVNLNAVITNENISYLDKLVDLAFYLGNVGGIGLDLLRVTGRACNNNVNIAGADDIRMYLKKAYERTIELEKLTGKKIVIREIEDSKRRLKTHGSCSGYCHAVYGGAMVVLPNGSIYPCGSLAYSPQYYMGNIYDEKSQRIVKVKTERPKRCTICEYEKFCAGACPSRSIINLNSKDIGIEECALRKVSFEIAGNHNNLAKSPLVSSNKYLL